MTGPSFVSLDFELANASFSSIDSIGVARVVDGEVVTVKHWFVRPPDPYDFLSPFNEMLTRISVEDLAPARGFDFHGPNLVNNLAGGILIGHGIRSADFPMMTQSWFAHPGLGPLPEFRYVDTVRVAQRVLPQLDKHRLNMVFEHLYGEKFGEHHRADADAEATAKILVTLLELSGTTLEEWVQIRPAQIAAVLKPPVHRKSAKVIPVHPTVVLPSTELVVLA